MTKIVSRWNADKTLAEGDGCVKNVLERAVKSGADLGGADLGGAYLGGAYLHGAYLHGAELRGAKVNWQSHSLVGEILLRAAGKNMKRRMVAGLIQVSTDLCWKNFLRVKCDEKKWALRELAKWVTEGDGAPDCLVKLAKTKVK